MVQTTLWASHSVWRRNNVAAFVSFRKPAGRCLVKSGTDTVHCYVAFSLAERAPLCCISRRQDAIHGGDAHPEMVSDGLPCLAFLGETNDLGRLPPCRWNATLVFAL